MMKPFGPFLVPLQLLLLVAQLQRILGVAASLTATSTESTIQSQQQQQDLNFMNKNYAEANLEPQLQTNNVADGSNPRARVQHSSQQLLVQASPIEISANDSTTSSGTGSGGGNYHGQQNSRIRVNVSNVCEKTHMKVTVRFSRPFYGLIHAKDRRKKAPCFVEGNGEQAYSLDISFTLLPTDVAYCGMVADRPQSAATWTRSSQQTNQQMNQSMLHGIQETLSLALVVRLHKSIEFNDDRYFLLSCPNRCPRSDCSTGPIDSSVASRDRKGFMASDSILAPIFRSGELRQTGIAVGSTAAGEPCDMMIDLKFQWLVKLCWILIGLIALMFCTIFYLCIASDQPSSRRARQPSTTVKDKHRREKHQVVTRRSTESQSQQSRSQSSERSSYPTKSTSDTTESLATTELGCWSSSVVQQDQQQVDMLRENNRYLASKQHMLLNEFLAAKNAMEEYEQQLMPPPRPNLGRSGADTAFNQRPFGNHVLRRRSIGGSAAMLDCLQSPETPLPSKHQQSFGQSCRLEPKHKLKSKSQTTIYYEQGQDPFKAIPFNSGGHVADYPSDDQSIRLPQKHYTDQGLNTQPRPYSYMEVQQLPQNGGDFIHNQQVGTQRLWPDFEPQSLPVLTNKYQANDLFVPNESNDRCRQQMWPIENITAEKPSLSLVNHPPNQQEQHNRLSASQFDPQSHSRQLIDLIQHKHREQMAQASRTAATLKPHHPSVSNSACLPPKPVARPMLLNQQQR